MTRADRATEEDRTGSVVQFLRELPVLLLVAFLLAFLLRTFVVQVFYIPSESMVPTLVEQDRMVVEKVTYLFREPVRGEVIVFAGEEPAGDDPGGIPAVVTGLGRFLGIVPADAADFVKRVVGLPGDTILIEDGQLSVNGDAVDEPYVVNGDTSSFGPVEVPAGSMFVMGDNRPRSSDSRSTMGYVEMENVVGRPVLLIWPLDRIGAIQSGP